MFIYQAGKQLYDRLGQMLSFTEDSDLLVDLSETQVF